MSDLPMDLAELEVALRDLSHDERAVQLVRNFAQRLGKTKQRQQLFNAPGALVRSPLDYDAAIASGAISSIIGYSNWEFEFSGVANFWFDNSLFVGKNWSWRGAIERVKKALF
ncbi:MULTISPECIES: hypothetical protein [unclassified Chamaesiphon]|uniref:hypothetical protein n=1 Tax=unclassified Chamaesiphon TaxID=2620921 RepID=UPI00286A8B18|nr:MULTISPECIES: hypothetical protein [unclassified Chamaesiphon]